ncbi:hypothetical protein M9H77_33005 [Catharanthus roseus]|uniref:Uncharacterized protein n=1 Tax=Catharanthus roseus TaxID=4058 RepID=A0ACC0A733_CATRO|nr:hypothetical protein M9H77_33005 [Catharanthus roseus]
MSCRGFTNALIERQVKAGRAVTVARIFEDLKSGFLSSVPEDGNTNVAEADVIDPIERCRLGYYFLILEEEIGVICKQSGIVEHEIKYISPDLVLSSQITSSFSFISNLQECDNDNAVEANVTDPIKRFQLGYHFMILDEEIGVICKYCGIRHIAGATMIEDTRTPFPESVNPTCHPVIMAPLTMLRAWGNELKRWKVNIPFHNLNDPEFQDRSILGIEYDLFERLTSEHSEGDHFENFWKILPAILFLDEDHTPCNKKSQLWKALTKVKSGRRIILTGTPFQKLLEKLETSLEAGVKTQFVIDIIPLGLYVDLLKLLMEHLTSYFYREEGKHVLYMDGAMDEKQRQSVIHSLNDDEASSYVNETILKEEKDKRNEIANKRSSRRSKLKMKSKVTLVATSSSEKETMLKKKSITEKEILSGVQKIGVSNS